VACRKGCLGSARAAHGGVAVPGEGVAAALVMACRYTYGEPQPVEQLARLVSDYKHSYTQYGGLRPFGVAFLFAGWDAYLGYQLYASDPAGNYTGWKATAIGANSQSAQSSLKSEYAEDMSFEAAQKCVLPPRCPAAVLVAMLPREGDAPAVAATTCASGPCAFGRPFHPGGGGACAVQAGCQDSDQGHGYHQPDVGQD
jgi:hypothetical protein